jgi:P-type E1-E2 ATPase
VREIDAAERVSGDVIQLRGGDDVPADCRLIEAFGAQVNTATVTGEFFAVGRDAAPSRSVTFALRVMPPPQGRGPGAGVVHLC